MNVSDIRILPRLGLPLTVAGLGCSPIGGLYTSVTLSDAAATVEAAWRLGIRFFDTAPYEGFTRSERRLGAVLSERRRTDFVLSTKVGRLMMPDDTVGIYEEGWAQPLPFRPTYDYTYSGVMRSFEHSQQRLGITHLDLLLVHDIGRITHGDRHPHYWGQLTQGGGFRALGELRTDGRIKGFGISADEFDIVHDVMQEAAIDCTMLAGCYTLLNQQSVAVLDECERHQNPIIVSRPFHSSILGRHGRFDTQRSSRDVFSQIQALASLCADFEVPLPAAALQFPLAHGAVVSCLMEARSPEELQTNINWFEMAIPADFWASLERHGLIDRGVPLPALV